MYDKVMSGFSMVSDYAFPAIVALILLSGAIKKVKLFDTFTEGVKEGFGTIKGLLPIMIGLVTAIGVFRASGAIELIQNAISPLAVKLQIPKEVVPLFLMKPVSGSASAGLAADIMARHGADSSIGKITAILLGSTDTIVYTFAIYFGAIGVKKTKYAGISAVIASCAALAAAVFLGA